jgi:membrane-bound inhibitor of C-type lysozyme
MKASFLALMLGAVACMLAPAPALAQTFQKYQCDDGAEFIMSVYASRRTAFVQLDGRRLTLKQRIIAVPGRKRYTREGVSISTKGDTAILRRSGKRADCTLVQSYSG